MSGDESDIASGPNAAQFDYWNQVAGPKWAGLAKTLDARLAAILALLLERADVRPGEHVLDVGCGAGTSTLALAERVGASGRVSGIDISEPMLEVARRRVADRGLSNVVLRRADAQIYAFGSGVFDRVVSRFGVMFFADPVAAFRNLREAMRPGGSLCFVCWAGLADNPHWRIPLEIVARRIGPPAPKPTHAPGPMALSDPAYVRGVLKAAGFSEPRILAEEVPLVGGSPEEEAAFASIMGPSGRLLDERDASDQLRDELRREIAEAFRPYVTEKTGAAGTVLPAAIYSVSAER